MTPSDRHTATALFVAIAMILQLSGCNPATNKKSKKSGKVQRKIPPDDLSNGPWNVPLPRARCIRIIDGDTIDLLYEKTGETVRTRLSGLDAPELEQAFGNQSKEFLTKLISGKEVSIRATGSDESDNRVAFLFLDQEGHSVDVSMTMLRSGMAWHLPGVPNDKTLAGLQENARENQKGLFSEPPFMEPWKWRKRSEQKRTQSQ